MLRKDTAYYVPCVRLSVCVLALDLEIDRVDRSSEREVESVDNIDSKSTFGSGADAAEHGEE